MATNCDICDVVKMLPLVNIIMMQCLPWNVNLCDVLICHLTKDQSSLRVQQEQDSELRNDSSKLTSLEVCGCGTSSVIQPVTLIQDEKIHVDKHSRRLLWLVYTTQTTRQSVTKMCQRQIRREVPRLSIDDGRLFYLIKQQARKQACKQAGKQAGKKASRQAGKHSGQQARQQASK